MAIKLRALRATDRAPLEAVVRSDDTFREDEVKVALELIDEAIVKKNSDYWFVVAAEEEESVVGYICYGPTPMTESSFDLYWIVTHRDVRGKGVAGQLIGAMERDVAAKGATGIRIETSQLESYGSARRVYDRHEYEEVARIPDFYRKGDALVTFYKRL